MDRDMSLATGSAAISKCPDKPPLHIAKDELGSPAPDAVCSAGFSVISVAVTDLTAVASRPIRSIIHSACRRWIP